MLLVQVCTSDRILCSHVTVLLHRVQACIVLSGRMSLGGGTRVYASMCISWPMYAMKYRCGYNIVHVNNQVCSLLSSNHRRIVRNR